ncbi:MAG: sugar phosphate isomerase/epimerase [Ferruginibacter sp.]
MKKIIQILICLQIGFEIQAQNMGEGELLFPQMPGMVSYTYRNSFQKDVALTLDTLKNLGFVDMEFSSLFGKTAAELKTMLDERGMYCSSLGVNYEDFTTKTAEVATNAKLLGANFVRVAWIPFTAPFTIEVAQKAVNDFNKVGKILKDQYQLTFCYHNHGYEFYPYRNQTLFDYIIQNTDPKYVNFEIDVLWTVFPGGDPVQLIRKYGNRFKLMHLKDLRKGVVGDLSGKTSTENDVALGTGQIDIRSILIASKKAGIEHYFIEDESSVYNKQVPGSLAFLKSLKH